MPPAEHAELGLGRAPEGYRSGFVSLLGRPNVGKSTLLNQILRHRVAITSERPQTTRNAVRGIHTTPSAQLVFVDTPGLHKPRSALGKQLNKLVRSTLTEVDAVAVVLDAEGGVGRGDAIVARELTEVKVPIVIVLNKTDRIDAAGLAAQSQRARGLFADASIVALSARTGTGVPDLVAALAELVPEGPPLYPPDTFTDQPQELLIAELVREKALQLTRDEVPHSVAVVVDETDLDAQTGFVTIDATIFVERDSQKGIVIGKGGRVLKEIGSRARHDIEELLGSHVLLRLRVKVEYEWQRSDALVQRFGYAR